MRCATASFNDETGHKASGSRQERYEAEPYLQGMDMR